MASFQSTAANADHGRIFHREPMVLAQIPRIGAVETPDIGHIRENITRSQSAGAYFVDRGHAQQRAAATELPARESHSAPLTSGTSHSAATSSTLFQLHSQVAPYAGLIVALALITCAGLLYWIISGPPSASLDYSDIYDIDGTHFGAQSVDSLETSAYALAPESSTPVPAEEEDGADPQSEQRLLVEMPSVDETAAELPFPETADPSPLDFSVLDADVMPRPLPEVSARVVPNLLTPTLHR